MLCYINLLASWLSCIAAAMAGRPDLHYAFQLRLAVHMCAQQLFQAAAVRRRFLQSKTHLWLMLRISPSKHTGPLATRVPKHIQSNMATTTKCAQLRLSHSQGDPHAHARLSTSQACPLACLRVQCPIALPECRSAHAQSHCSTRAADATPMPVVAVLLAAYPGSPWKFQWASQTVLACLFMQEVHDLPDQACLKSMA